MSEQPDEAARETARGDSIVFSIMGTLIAGPALYGLVGLGVDALAGTSVFVPIGIVVGFALSFYIVYVRYGRD
jgi:F0F1-type ATP synthase assembly protein I